MKAIPLKDYVELENKTQTDVAAEMGITQGALSKMLKSGRKIILEFDSDQNVISWHDIKTTVMSNELMALTK